jgi:hypothetical protein
MDWFLKRVSVIWLLLTLVIIAAVVYRSGGFNCVVPEIDRTCRSNLHQNPDSHWRAIGPE